MITIDSYVYYTQSESIFELGSRKLGKDDIWAIIELLYLDSRRPIFVYKSTDGKVDTSQEYKLPKSAVVHILQAYITDLYPIEHYHIAITIQDEQKNEYTIVALVDNRKVAILTDEN